MDILIVGRTKMHSGVCIGGLVLETNQSVRLLPPTGHNHKLDTPFQVGQIWNIEITPAEHLQPPHMEDVRIKKYSLVRQQDQLASFLGRRIKPWCGGINVLFNGFLRYTASGTAYIARSSGVPQQSTGYWIADRLLYRGYYNDKVKYLYSSPEGSHYITYVGFEPSVQVIKAGTLIRVSLARWWAPDDAPGTEERCYLQLSGWYQN